MVLSGTLFITIDSYAIKIKSKHLFLNFAIYFVRNYEGNHNNIDSFYFVYNYI